MQSGYLGQCLRIRPHPPSGKPHRSSTDSAPAEGENYRGVTHPLTQGGIQVECIL